MNTVITLIDDRVKTILSGSDFVLTAPCVIKKLLADNMVEVQMVSDGRKFTVLNGSGVQLAVNDEAKLAYRGYISDGTSYIIAAKGENGLSIYSTLNSDLTVDSLVKIRQTKEAFLITVDVEAGDDLASGDIVLATKTNLFPYPVSEIDATYYSVARDSSGNIYDLEARLSDGDADSEGNKYGKLEVVVVAGSTVTDGTKLRGQIFAQI